MQATGFSVAARSEKGQRSLDRCYKKTRIDLTTLDAKVHAKASHTGRKFNMSLARKQQEAHGKASTCTKMAVSKRQKKKNSQNQR
jgi:hypothetical protein